MTLLIQKFSSFFIIFWLCRLSLTHAAEDPLLETIWKIESGNIIKQQELIEQMLAADVIYLGEKHDNTRQHEIQVQILEDLVRKGKRPSIGFEFFALGQTSILMNYTQPSAPMMGMKSKDINPEAILRQSLGWDHRPDVEWNFYFNLIEVARKNQLSAFATDIPWELSARITRIGIENLQPTELSLLVDTGLNNSDYEEIMLEEFTNVHCGYRNEEMFRRMYQAWIARNDAMAQAIVDTIEANPENPVVMIVGFGHLRHGMGIPERVAYLRPKTKQINFLMMEINQEPSSLKSYLPELEINGRTFRQDFDYIWFTSRQDVQDPCEGFRMHSE
jgi:uncharacterized iron-regulated protein